MSAPLRYVQIGAGGWGRHWCEEVLPRLSQLKLAEPAAVVDIAPEALAGAKIQLNLDDSQLYEDAEAAIQQTKPDFVNIVVPPALHERMVDIALRHGCHILSEKPIADTMAACCRIYHKVKAADRKMAVTMSHRFDQDKQTLEAELRRGSHGRLHYIVCRFTHNCREFGSWGGTFRHTIPDPLLIEGAVHHFDIFRALAGANAKTVYALTWNPPWGAFAGDSTAMVSIEMENGTRCFYEGAKANAATMNGWTEEYFRAECEFATLELDRRRIRLLRGPAWEPPVASEIPLLQQPAWMNAWLAELFVNWLNGGPEPANTLEDNLQCVALVFAAVESAHTGRVVDVQAFLDNELRSAGRAGAAGSAGAAGRAGA